VARVDHICMPPASPSRKQLLPNASEAMSLPLQVQPEAKPGKKDTGGMTRFEKEKQFIIHHVNKRMGELNFENYFYLAKSVCFWVGFLFMLLGVVLIMKGNSLTPIFAADPFDLATIITGGCFCLPMLVWFMYVFCLPIIPSVGRKRKLMREMRKERKNPSLFNQMVESAQEDSKPPVKMIRISLLFRKHVFSVSCHTVQEMCDAIEYRTGLRPGQQLFKYKNEEVTLPYEMILEDDLGIRDGTMFDLYNRGGFVHDIRSSPENRLTLPHEGHSEDDASTFMTRSISRFKRDPHSYMRELHVEDGSTGDVSSLGRDQSTIAGPGPGSVMTSPPQSPVKSFAFDARDDGTVMSALSSPSMSVAQKKQSVAGLIASPNSKRRKKKVAVGDVPDDMSALTEMV